MLSNVQKAKPIKVLTRCRLPHFSIKALVCGESGSIFGSNKLQLVGIKNILVYGKMDKANKPA